MHSHTYTHTVHTNTKTKNNRSKTFPPPRRVGTKTFTDLTALPPCIGSSTHSPIPSRYNYMHIAIHTFHSRVIASSSLPCVQNVTVCTNDNDVQMFTVGELMEQRLCGLASRLDLSERISKRCDSTFEQPICGWIMSQYIHIAYLWLDAGWRMVSSSGDRGSTNYSQQLH
jgi:hypothetical protein